VEDLKKFFSFEEKISFEDRKIEVVKIFPE